MRLYHTVARAPSQVIGANDSGVLVYNSPEFTCKRYIPSNLKYSIVFSEATKRQTFVDDVMRSNEHRPKLFSLIPFFIESVIISHFPGNV